MTQNAQYSNWPFAATLGLSIFLGLNAWSFPSKSEAYTGPATFPLLLSVCLLLLSIVGIYTTTRTTTKTDNRIQKPDTDNNTNRFPILFLLVAGYLSLINHIGFIISTVLLFSCSLYYLGYRYILRAIAAGCITSFSLYYLFGVIMHVDLPKI